MSQKNEDVPSQNLDGLLEKFGERKKTEVTAPIATNNALTYAQIEFEIFSKKRRKRQSYATSLKRVRDNGFERHPRPAEALGALFDAVSSRGAAPLAVPFAENFFNVNGAVGGSRAEWLSAALRLDGSMLDIYLDPLGSGVWRSGHFSFDMCGFKYSHHESFDIDSILSHGSINLTWLPSDLCTLLCGRTPRQATKFMRKSVLYLPEEGEVRPLNVSFMTEEDTSDFPQEGERYLMLACSSYAFSRGVRPHKGGTP